MKGAILGRHIIGEALLILLILLLLLTPAAADCITTTYTAAQHCKAPDEVAPALRGLRPMLCGCCRLVLEYHLGPATVGMLPSVSLALWS